MRIYAYTRVYVYTRIYICKFFKFVKAKSFLNCRTFILSFSLSHIQNPRGQMFFLVPDFYSVFFTISFRRMAGRTFFKLPDPTELTFLAGQAPSCISASCVHCRVSPSTTYEPHEQNAASVALTSKCNQIPLKTETPVTVQGRHKNSRTKKQPEQPEAKILNTAGGQEF